MDVRRAVILEHITRPADIRGLDGAEIAALCAELREHILDSVAACGGHLASNLGIVETTVALHRVFDAPRDTIVFDVGHQCYAHKMLTGRAGRFGTLRQTGGLSGFPRREESEYDPFTSGHSGASLSAALGVAEANRLIGSDAWSVAVIGDGSFTNGMIYEALSGCKRGLRLVIVLNDNEMSISKNVGALSDYFTRIRVSREYFAFKRAVKDACSHIPLAGKPMISLAVHIKEFIKRALNQKNLFESLGLEYLGPVDGADESAVEDVLREAKECDAPCVVHVVTKKGRGYFPAEEHPESYHSVAPFSLARGVTPGASPTFSSEFGRILCEMAEEDEKLCAVTAAMRDGTGLTEFARRNPARLFDVGIAEEHAVTFAAGLARAGMHPVAAIYSTFAQRAFDQVLHDAALQRLPLTLALDRAGIVPGDGATHEGLFDVGLFSPIPGVEIFSPESYAELEEAFRRARGENPVRIVRYPRGAEIAYDRSVWVRTGDIFTADFGASGERAVILTYGVLAAEALRAADRLAEAGMRVRVVRLRRLFPLPETEILCALEGADVCVFAEEGMRRGGVGEALAARLAAHGGAPRLTILAADSFVWHGDRASLLRELRLDAAGIADEVRKEMKKGDAEEGEAGDTVAF